MQHRSQQALTMFVLPAGKISPVCCTHPAHFSAFQLSSACSNLITAPFSLSSNLFCVSLRRWLVRAFSSRMVRRVRSCAACTAVSFVWFGVVRSFCLYTHNFSQHQSTTLRRESPRCDANEANGNETPLHTVEQSTNIVWNTKGFFKGVCHRSLLTRKTWGFVLHNPNRTCRTPRSCS